VNISDIAMTVGMIVGLILLPFSWMLMAAVNKQHREETGVNMPSRSAMRRIRKAARKKSIGEVEAYSDWVRRKQKLSSAKPSTRSAIVPITNEAPAKPGRIRAPEHQPFEIEHLESIAHTFGWMIMRQAGGLFYIRGLNKQIVENPYAEEDAIKTDFTRRDLEDFLLTCL
jgi:hypothetical protein